MAQYTRGRRQRHRVQPQCTLSLDRGAVQVSAMNPDADYVFSIDHAVKRLRAGEAVRVENDPILIGRITAMVEGGGVLDGG